ncbi:hypothetical protein MCEME17_00137 [Candidatus Pelagibacterales bacterium]
MTKGYLGWRGVIKLAKELDYSWQEVCEVLYRKKVNPKTTYDQIVICARIKYDLELIKAGVFLRNCNDGRIIKPLKYEKDIHYVVRANLSTFKDYLNKRSKLKINSNSDVFRAIRDMYAKKMRLYPDKIKKAFREILPAPQVVAQLQNNIK